MVVVTRLDVRRALVEYGLAHKTNAEIDTAMATVDQEAYFHSERAGLAAAVWDGETPINGAEPEVVRNSHGLAEDDIVYVIYANARAVVFQPRVSARGVMLTHENALFEAELAADEMAKQAAKPRIIEAVIDRLDY